MKYIFLLEELSEKDAKLLRKIGIEINGLTLECEDNRDIYFRQQVLDYYIHCYDDKNPVASFTIKNTSWDSFQDVSINERNIEAALERMQQANLDGETKEYPSFNERKKMIKEGNYEFLFKIPFSELRYDEQIIVKQKGYKFENEDNFYPLTLKGLEIVELIKSTRTNLDALKHSTSYFVGREDTHKMYGEHHVSIWNSLIDGNHELTSGLTKDQIQGYFSIAKGEFAPANFNEPEEKTMQVFFKLITGKIIALEIRSDEKWLQIKQKIQEKVGIAVSDQRIIMGGNHVLDQEKPYEDFRREGYVPLVTNNQLTNKSSQFFSISSEVFKEWEWDKPSMAVVILAFFIPIVGWGYLGYLLWNKICELLSSDGENQPIPLSQNI